MDYVRTVSPSTGCFIPKYVFHGEICDRLFPHNISATYGTRQKECNKHAAAALENMAACALLFSHQKVMHFDGCATVRRLLP